MNRRAFLAAATGCAIAKPSELSRADIDTMQRILRHSMYQLAAEQFKAQMNYWWGPCLDTPERLHE